MNGRAPGYSLRRMKRQRTGPRDQRHGSLAKSVPLRGALPATAPRPFASRALSPAHPSGGGLAGFPAHWSNWSWLAGLLLVLGTILAYQPAWHGGFLWDDDTHVTKNRMLVEADGLKQIWTSPESPQYYPMVWTSFRLERALWGLEPTGYHWVNLLLHAGSAVLLWQALRRLKAPGAWLAAAVFALHPVNVESVAWISQRKNTLAMFFYMLSVLCYLRFDPAPRPSPLALRPLGSPQPSTLNPQPLCVLAFTGGLRGGAAEQDGGVAVSTSAIGPGLVAAGEGHRQGCVAQCAVFHRLAGVEPDYRLV